MIPWDKISKFITPAAILSLAVYFERLFGKMLADQKPFADDRNWEIEFSGLWFFVDFILPTGIIAVALLSYFKSFIMSGFGLISSNFSPINYHWVDFIIVFLIGGYYVIAATILSEGRYKITALVPKTAWGGSDVPEEKRNKIFNRVLDINAALMQPSLALLIFIFGVEIYSGEIIWISLFAVQIFSVLIGLTLNYSLMRYSLPRANVHFTGARKSLKGVWLIKVNKDNVKIRDSKRTLIIERSHVLELEIVDAEQKPEIKRPVVPFIIWIPWLLALYLFWENNFWMALLLGAIIPFILFLIGAWLLAP